MTLDEAIAHAKEKANEQRRRFEDIYGQEETTEAERKEAIACLDCSNEHGMLAAWLTELQERRQADRWVPVSERLPEDYTRVLITNEYGEVICIDWNTWYQKEYKDARKSYKATAWRPLPEPYESEDKE